MLMAQVITGKKPVTKSPSKIRFFCTQCNWKFSAYFEPNLCPYCGKKNTIQMDTSQGADDLIREIEDIEGQMRDRH